MRLVLRILLLLAGFAYGAMPLLGAASAGAMAPEFGTASAPEIAAPIHHGGAMTGAGIPCPHATDLPDTEHPWHMPIAGGHCGACLTLAPMTLFLHPRLDPEPAEAPGLAPRLTSTPSVPLERPPRLRG